MPDSEWPLILSQLSRQANVQTRYVCSRIQSQTETPFERVYPDSSPVPLPTALVWSGSERGTIQLLPPSSAAPYPTQLPLPEDSPPRTPPSSEP